MCWLEGDRYIGRSLKQLGEWCDAEVRLLCRLLPRNAIVIESGANIGADTIPLAKHANSGWVYAFEPQPVIFHLLQANVLANQLTNVIATQAATYLKAGTASIPDLDYGSENNFGGVSLLKEGLGGADVPVVTLDEVIPEDNRIALIKADVEGMELGTLLGAGRLIGRCRPVIYVENNPGAGPNSAELIRFLTQIDYRCWWHVVPLFDPGNWRSVQEDLWAGTASTNMACLPSGDPRTAQLAGLPPVLSPRDRPPTRLGKPAASQPLQKP